MNPDLLLQSPAEVVGHIVGVADTGLALEVRAAGVLTAGGLRAGGHGVPVELFPPLRMEQGDHHGAALGPGGVGLGPEVAIVVHAADDTVAEPENVVLIPAACHGGGVVPDEGRHLGADLQGLVVFTHQLGAGIDAAEHIGNLFPGGGLAPLSSAETEVLNPTQVGLTDETVGP